MPLLWRDEVLNTPIIRKCDKENGVLKEPMSLQVFERLWKSIMSKAGYSTSITIHAVRRGLGKKLDGR